MTREELKDICVDAYEYSGAFESTSGTQGKKLVDWTIEILARDLENRVCENCEYYEEYPSVCCNADSPLCTDVVDKTFGCNEFKRKLNDN